MNTCIDEVEVSQRTFRKCLLITQNRSLLDYSSSLLLLAIVEPENVFKHWRAVHQYLFICIVLLSYLFAWLALDASLQIYQINYC